MPTEPSTSATVMSELTSISEKSHENSPAGNTATDITNRSDIQSIISSVQSASNDNNDGKQNPVVVVVVDSNNNGKNTPDTGGDPPIYPPVRRTSYARNQRYMPRMDPSGRGRSTRHGHRGGSITWSRGYDTRRRLSEDWIQKNSVLERGLDKTYDSDLEMGSGRDGGGAGGDFPPRPLSMSAGGADKGLDYEEHLGDGRQYWRDIILGVNDGLVSTFLLIAGVTGSGLSNTDILLTALAGTIAGAISMCAGEYVATKTQNEVLEGELNLERKHIAQNRDSELQELTEVFENIGIPADGGGQEVTELRERLLAYYGKNDEAHLQCHAALELGLVEDEERNPFIAGGVAFFLFLLGALPSVIPFLIPIGTNAAFIAAGVCTTIGLLLVGIVKTWATRGNWVTAAAENLAIAVGGGGIAYAIGYGFELLVHEGDV